MRNASRATILDVAALAGVHAGTVSRALNHPDQVAVETRQRVERAVVELGFVPNRAARGLITGRTGNVGVIVPDITNPFFGTLVRAIERSARETDQHVLLVDTGEQGEAEAVAARRLEHEVDGFIVASPRRLHRPAQGSGATPMVFVNRPSDRHSAVLMRSADAWGQAVRHLAELDHCALAFVAGPRGSWSAAERRASVVSTARRLGVALEVVQAATPTTEDAAGVVEDILRRRCTAVMAFNDQLALGLIAEFARRGVSVPEDVSVMGCDDVPLAGLVAPPLTTITMPTAAAGAAAVAALTGEQQVEVELHGELVIRSSTGPASRPTRARRR